MGIIEIKNVKVLILGSKENQELVSEIKSNGYESEFFKIEEPLKDVTTNFNFIHLLPAVKYAQQHGFDIIIGADQSTNKMCVAVKNQNGIFQLFSPHQLAAILLHQRKGETPRKPLLIAKSIHLSEMIDKMLFNEEIKKVDFLLNSDPLHEKVKELSEQHDIIEVLAFTENQEIIDTHYSFSALVEKIISLENELKEEGKTLFDLMIKLYREYGFYKEKTFIVDLNDIRQKEHILHVMDEIRRKPSTVSEALAITTVIDYKKGVFVNLLSKKKIPIQYPPQNILQIKLVDGTSISFVPREDKMYFYISIKGINYANEDYEENNKHLDDKILKIIQVINKL